MSEMADEKKVTLGYSGKPERPRVLLTDQLAVCELLSGVQLAVSENLSSRGDSTATYQQSEVKETLNTGDPSLVTVSEKMFCSFCETNFTDRDNQKEHYKTDWHRYNLRQKLKDLNPILEDKFEELVAGDISSISGSDSAESADEEESEKVKKFSLPQPVFNRPTEVDSDDSDGEMSGHVEGIGRRHPRVFVRNEQGQLLSIYRCVVHGKKNQPETKEDLVSMVTAMPRQTKWAVLMNAAGHFAAAVFDKGVVVEHKTFHRYTVRAKRGTAQGLKDKQGGGIHSAGASLRRYNEAALTQEVSELIGSWSEHMQTCDRIFIRAPSFNRAIFFGGKNPPLDKKDTRIRLIPFPTRRPTFSELQRVHTLLATIECYGEEETIRDHIKTSPKRPVSAKARTASSQPQGDAHRAAGTTEQDDGDDEDEIQLVASLETNDLRPLESTKKAKKKKKKPNKDVEPVVVKIAKEVAEPSSPLIEFNDEEYTMRNELYTACKIGNTERLREILSPLLPKCANDDTTQGAHSQDEPVKLLSKNTIEDTTQGADSQDEPVKLLSKSANDDTTQGADSQDEPIPLLSKNTNDDTTQGVVSQDEPIPLEKKGDHADRVIDKDCEDLTGLDCPGEGNKSEDTILKVDPTKDCEDISSPPEHDKAAVPSEAQRVLKVDLLNAPFGESRRTLLHVAAGQDHAETVACLLEAGADPSIRDSEDKPPYITANQRSVRNQFRQFMAKYPDRYDYTVAQIPAPISSEREAEKKVKDAERRKQAKKARQFRLKDKKAEEAIQAAEQKEKERYLNLSEREKRALAAERRLLTQINTVGDAAPVLSRCWQCGVDITGKIPFEYYDYKFCTPKCLKDHKQAQKKS